MSSCKSTGQSVENKILSFPCMNCVTVNTVPFSLQCFLHVECMKSGISLTLGLAGASLTRLNKREGRKDRGRQGWRRIFNQF